MYEDPNIAIQKFVKEIDPSAISKQKVIGVGKICFQTAYLKTFFFYWQRFQHFCPPSALLIRRVWGSVSRCDENWERRSDRSDKDPEARLLGETEAGLLERGQHHGSVLTPKHHPAGGSRHQM